MQNVAVVDIARRFDHNPLLTPTDFKPINKGMTVKCLLNPGVFKFEKKTWLLVRVAECPVQGEDYVSVPIFNDDGELEILQFDKYDPLLDVSSPKVITYKNNSYLTTVSHLRLMCTEDGTTFYEPEGYHPILGTGPLETYGIEDCCVTEIDGLFHLAYTMVSSFGTGIGLMQTRDWKRFERKGMIFPPNNKHCALFEEKVRDKYYALHQPFDARQEGNHIWLAESPDLIHWGHHKCIASTRKGMWDSVCVAAGASPIRTPKGWLVIYQGSDENHRYCLGAILLDIKDPAQVIARSEFPIMEPTDGYELTGFIDNVISSKGHLVIGDRVQLYYGAADEVICRADLSIHEILNSLSIKKLI